ncbi:FAD-binding protein [Adhaeribacter rhizoryzae]|uniref:FAD-binding protein n=1 Tax=Adhaeribacter rhizoryzae TaxID=2607907 RepID=A0A5M6DR60_9BACT|nr:FAD-binding protein [Adhaeribacter rhizoryzae]KAA5547905.1 FAD-binding protein [Adhaeribacter rhizoryzae]
MNLPLGIKPLKINKWKWTNAHANFTQHLKKDASFELTVSDPEFKQQFPTFKEKYHQTTRNMQWLIKYAIDHKIKLRAMGSGWSLSKVGVTDDGLINTKKLTLKAELSESQVAPEYLAKGGSANDLLFAQCGNEIIRINDLLEKERNPAKSLRVSGGSNGQTIVGAFSTGTHGAAFKYGSVCDCVVGMHLVVGPNRHVWLERASYPVISDAFRAWLQAEVIQDDDLFNAALVSFGSFGIMHSVLIEVEPKFLLQQQLTQIPYNSQLEKAIISGDFSDLAPILKGPVPDLYHFELAINPHNFQKNNQPDAVYFRVMYKRPYQPGYTPFDPSAKGKFTYGDDVLGLMQSVLDAIDKFPGNKLDLKLIPKTVNSLFKLAYNRPEAALGTIGETFRNTIFRGQLFSAAYGFSREVVPQLIDIFLELNKKIPFVGIMAFRFVKGSPATLAFAKFPNTCVLELDGADTQINYKFAEAFIREVESKNIPYSVHWGKINHVLNKERVRKIYGDATIDKWLGHRRQLLADEAWQVFNNEFLELCGLDRFQEAVV